MRSANIARLILGILGILSLCSVLVSELHRLQSKNEQLNLELSVLQSRLKAFTRTVGSTRMIVNLPTNSNNRSSDIDTDHQYYLPPLESILDEEGNVIGSPQALLQFAVIGFGKCGTSSLMHWLHQHPELQMLTSEVWALTGRDPARLIRRLHKNLQANLQRGYKCPGDVLSNFALDFYRTSWPKTKLFIGIRHPIWWFQSLYNFRIQNFKTFEQFPHPNEFIDSCPPEWSLLCIQRGFFGQQLMKLGKQNWNGTRSMTQLEQSMIDIGGPHAVDTSRTVPLPNEIFLFELSQLSDESIPRIKQFKSDIQAFLGLKEPLPDLVHFTPGKKWRSKDLQLQKDAKKIDICEDQFLPVRQKLLQFSQLSSQWLRQEWMHVPSVHTSSQDYLEHLLATEWMVDPCGEKSELVSDEEIARIIRETITGNT